MALLKYVIHYNSCFYIHLFYLNIIYYNPFISSPIYDLKNAMVNIYFLGWDLLLFIVYLDTFFYPAFHTKKTM